MKGISYVVSAVLILIISVAIVSIVYYEFFIKAYEEVRASEREKLGELEKMKPVHVYIDFLGCIDDNMLIRIYNGEDHVIKKDLLTFLDENGIVDVVSGEDIPPGRDGMFTLKGCYRKELIVYYKGILIKYIYMD